MPEQKSVDIIELQNRIRQMLATRNIAARELIEEHRQLAEINADPEHLGESYINFALYYCMIEPDLARFLRYGELAKPYFDLNNKRRVAYYYGNIAYGYQLHSQMPQSQSFFLKAIDSMEQIPDLSVAETKRLASHYYNLYILFGFSDLGTLDQRYIERALELNTSINHKLGISYNYSAIVAEYDRQGRITEALDFALKRIDIVEELNDRYQLGLAWCSAGLMYAKSGLREKAFEYFDKAHGILFPNGIPEFQAGYYLELAEANYVFTNFRDAISAYHEAIKLYELNGSSLNLSKIYRLLSKAYKEAGMPADALAFQEKYSQSLLDSFKLDKLLAVTATEHEYEQRQQAIETAMLKQKNEEISKYVRQLEESNEDLKQFAHAASHDIREPVRTIVSYATLLELSLKGRLNPDEIDYINYLKNAGKRVYDMINGLLAFSKVNNLQEVSMVDLNPICQQAIENIRLFVAAKKAIVQVPDLPMVLGSSTLLIQLFQNLISNGIKYNESAVPIVRVSCTDSGNRFDFCISDNGIGIDEKYKDDIYDMFTRIHKSDQYQGTGIGLSICRKIIERLGGRIKHQRNAAGGTDFLFSLPKAGPGI